MFELNELLKTTSGRLVNPQDKPIIKGISIDSRTINNRQAFIAIKGDNFDGHDFIDTAIQKGASCVIIQEDISSKRKIARLIRTKHNKINIIAVKDTIKALGDIACLQRRKFDIPVIAVTGSNGKTTTKEMIAWILSHKFKVLKNEGTKNNQIGLPLTLLNLNNSHDIVVVELGTNHPGEIEYLSRISQPNIGMITNIADSHLQYLNNLKGVFREKYTLIENLRKPSIAILNADDPFLRGQISKQIKNPIAFGFGISNRTDFFGTSIKFFSKEVEFFVNDPDKNNISHPVKPKYKIILKTLGCHNIYNALAAVVVARIFGIEYKDIITRFSTFDFPQGRLKVKQLGSIKFIDDTYNSNPLSLRNALDTLANFGNKGRKIFVMGDMLELGRKGKLFHHQIGEKITGTCDIFITVGNLAKFAADAARRSGFDVNNLFICESNIEARDILLNKISLKSSDIVLVKGSRAMKMEEIFKAC